jgi:hypothetical protein
MTATDALGLRATGMLPPRVPAQFYQAGLYENSRCYWKSTTSTSTGSKNGGLQLLSSMATLAMGACMLAM